MKALPFVLAASLIANAILLTAALRRDSAAGPGSSASSPGTPKTSVPSGAHTTLSPELLAALNGNDSEALRDLLRAAGLSDDLIRSIVQARLWKRHEERFKALNARQNDPHKPWWKDDPAQQNRWGGMSKAEREESRRLQREIKAESERLFGPETNPNPWMEQRLSFLPPEKRRTLIDIQQDYQELISEIQQDSQGFRLPSDAEKLRFLQEEQKRDMQAVLTPEEYQAYELRNSTTANRLRGKMTQFDATEEEYLAIFPLQKAFDDRYDQQNNDLYGYGGQGERDQNYWKQRQDAEKQLQEQIRGVLGEERHAESIRRQDADYQQLEAATRRLALPADTPQKLFAVRDTVSASVRQITENPAYSSEQKKQELTALAASTRDQVRASLGEEGAQAYFKNNGMTWLKELERGNTVTFRTDSPGYTTKALPKDPQKAAAK